MDLICHMSKSRSHLIPVPQVLIGLIGHSPTVKPTYYCLQKTMRIWGNTAFDKHSVVDQLCSKKKLIYINIKNRNSIFSLAIVTKLVPQHERLPEITGRVFSVMTCFEGKILLPSHK